MTKKARTIGVIAIITVLFAGTAIAQGYGRHDGGMPGGGMPGGGMDNGTGPMVGNIVRLLWALDLTDAQQDEIESIMTNARNQMEELREDATEQNGRDEFMTLFTSATLTVSDLEEQFGNSSNKLEEMQSIMFQAIVDIHDVLTDEQLADLAELADNLPDHRGFGDRGDNSGPAGGIHGSRSTHR